MLLFNSAKAVLSINDIIKTKNSLYIVYKSVMTWKIQSNEVFREKAVYICLKIVIDMLNKFVYLQENLILK